MAEQLRFQQVARDRAAVYRNEAVMRPLAFVMEGCRNDFLAAAGRPGDHDGGVRTRNLSDQVADPANSVAITNDAVLRSEERRVGKECVSTCKSRGARDH